MRGSLALVLLLFVSSFASGVIRSACETDYPPFCFEGENGSATGFSVELMTEALGSMDHPVSFFTGPWFAVKDSLQNGSIDCLPLAGRTPERESYFDFTFPYMTLFGSVVVRADCDTVLSMSDLAGMRVGVMSADNAEEFLYREGYDELFEIVPAPTYAEALLQLESGLVDAVIMQQLVAQGLLARTGLSSSLQICNWPVLGFRQDFCFAVQEGNAELLAVLNEGLSNVIQDGTYSYLHAKWFAHMEIMSSSRITVGADRDFPPFEFIDSAGVPRGLNIDLIRLTAAEAGLDVEIRMGDWADMRAGLASGEIDVLCGMFYSPARDLSFDFTPAHTPVSYVPVVASGEAPSGWEGVQGLRIAVQNNDIAHDYILQKGFEGEMLLFPTQEEALEAVFLGEADCAVVADYTADYYNEVYGWELTVGDRPLVTPELSFAVRQGNAPLLAMLSHGLQEVKENGGYRRAFSEWMGGYADPASLSIREILRRSLVFLVPLLVLLLLVFAWVRTLKRQVRLRTSELKRSLDILSSTQKITLVGGWQYDIRQGTMHWTEETFRIHGIEPGETGEAPEELVALSLGYYPGGQRERIEELFRRCVQEGIPYDFESSFVLPDGTEKWIRTGANAEYLNGKIARVTGYIRDITEAKKAEDERKYRERLLSEMGGIANVGGWEFDPDTGESSWTEEVSRIYGYPVSRRITLEMAVNAFRGKNRERMEKALKLAQKYQQSYDMELELETPEGEKKWVRTIGRPVVKGGKVVSIQGTIQDITEMKVQETRIAHLNLVLRAIRDINQLIVREFHRVTLLEKATEILVKHRSYGYALMVAVDESGKPVLWRHSGLAEMAGKIDDFFAAGNLPPCYEAVKAGCNVVDRSLCSRCSLWKKDTSLVELCAPLENAGVRYGYLSVSLLGEVKVNEEEKDLLSEMSEDLGYALAGIRDREARIKAEADREEMQRQLLQSQKMEAVGQLAGGVAHDFNNMLQVILGHAQMLRESCGSEESLSSIEGILEGGRRASELTKQLLMFSRRQVMNLRTVDFNELVENLLRMIRRLIGEHIRLEWLPGSGAGSVRADAGMLEQVIMNLCLNARDAMPSGGVLTIETMNVVIDSAYCANHSWAVPGRYVLLAVTDTGIGMTRETLERIFEPFYTTKKEGKGTGIGLATVYGIVKQHEGMINAYSEPGRGSLFKVYLPMTEQKAEKVGAVLNGRVVGGTETVLLAEDDPLVRELAEQMLSRAGYTVLSARDGEEAVSMFSSDPGVDLLLLDVIMPKLGGYEAYERIRELDDSVPVLFSSGYSRNAIHTDFVLHEGLYLLQKPYSSDELLRAVRQAIDGKQQN